MASYLPAFYHSVDKLSMFALEGYLMKQQTGLTICPKTLYYQYSETNVMHFLFSLLRIKSLYMFRALLTHPQEALYKRHLVYCVLNLVDI
jgi:hypothetical protein